MSQSTSESSNSRVSQAASAADKVNRIAGAAGAVGAIGAYLLTFMASERVFWIGVLMAFLASVAGLYCAFILKRDGISLGLGDKPPRVPRYGWTTRILWVAFFAVTVGVGYYGWRYGKEEIFALARIDQFKGSQVVCSKSKEARIPDILFMADFEMIPFAVDAELSSASGEKVRIDEVKVIAEPLDLPVSPVSGISQENAIPPHVYYASLKRQPQAFDAILYDADKPSLAIPFINDRSFAKLHVEFEGERGVYQVRLEIRLRDSSGKQTQIVKTEQAIRVFVPGRSGSK
jgi:hypothetical protein